MNPTTRKYSYLIYLVLGILSLLRMVEVTGFITHVGRPELLTASLQTRFSSPYESGRASESEATARKFLVFIALAEALALSPLPNSPCFAYDAADYAIESVQNAVKSLEDTAGNIEDAFQAYEGIAEIIAEGKGVGGSVDYKGVTLERGFIADEDTSIYNPGLTLLTEGEKQQLVNAMMLSRKAGIEKNQWSERNQSAYSYLKFQLDPLHMKELRGYLNVAPILFGVAYLGVLAIQQLARDLFPVAYITAVVAVAAPAAILVLTAQ